MTPGAGCCGSVGTIECFLFVIRQRVDRGALFGPTGGRRWGWSFFCGKGGAALLCAALFGCATPSPPPAPASKAPGIVLRPVTHRASDLGAPRGVPITVAPQEASPPPKGGGAVPENPAPSSGAPAASGAPARQGHILQPGDVILLEVFREPELSGRFKLTPDGAIQHQLLGVVPLRGMTPDEAEALLRQRLAEKYLVNPRVILKLESTTATQILLIGEVKTPGILSVPYGERITLLEAIARAGGFTPKASPNRVTVVRTANGKQETLRVRVSDVLAGRPGHRDIPLEPNDVVTVPEVWF